MRRTTEGLKSAEEMSDYQQDGELAEALKVQTMSESAFSEWLNSSWGRLQAEANTLYAMVDWEPSGGAHHFRTLEEKNRFDREREIAFALRVAAVRAGKLESDPN